MTAERSPRELRVWLYGRHTGTLHRHDESLFHFAYGVPWKGTVPQRVRIPPGKLSLQPVAIGADDGGNDIVRSTPMERVALGGPDRTYVEDGTAPPLSKTLPLQHEPCTVAASMRWFDGLMPEPGRRVKLKTLVGATSEQTWALLASAGMDCAGAVQVGEEGERAETPWLDRLTWSELERLLQHEVNGESDERYGDAKNYAIVEPGTVRAQLAPAYDVMSSECYPALREELATSIGEVIALDAVTGEAVEALGEEAGLDTAQTRA